MSPIRKINFEDPEVRRLVEILKREIAEEYGIQIPVDGYWGKHASRDLGKIGSQLQKRLPLLLEHRKTEPE